MFLASCLAILYPPGMDNFGHPDDKAAQKDHSRRDIRDLFDKLPLEKKKKLPPGMNFGRSDGYAAEKERVTQMCKEVLNTCNCLFIS